MRLFCSLVALFVIACSRAPSRTVSASDGLPPRYVAQVAPFGKEVRRDLERVRAATARFRDIDAAHAAGYPDNKPPCLSNAASGAMGHHYVDRAHAMDDQVDVEHPEILLYAPPADSSAKPRLLGVEYIIPLRLWTRPEPPRVFGQTMKRSEELKLWYLHVWAWEENDAGLFADWNPAVKC